MSCADKEAGGNTTTPATNKTLADDTLCDAEDQDSLAKLSAGEFSHDLLTAEQAIKAGRIQAQVAELTKVLDERTLKVPVLMLWQLNQQQMRELRAAIRRLAGLLDFRWNGRFLSHATLGGIVPRGAPFIFGDEPCPEFLVLRFQSGVDENPSGERVVTVYGIETAQEILAIVASSLAPPSRST